MAKGIYLAAGAIAYAVFFATFLYLIGFVGDIPGVPKTVDTGGAGRLPVAVIVDLALIALFGVQHSVMARPAFKARWTRIVPAVLERSVYLVFASLALILLFVVWMPIPQPIWTIENPAAVIMLWTLFALGWLIVLLSTFLINHFELFGLQQIWLHLRGKMATGPTFRTPLLYRLVRHPLYSGFLLAFWSTPTMTLGHLVFALGMSIYVLIAIRHEERDLVGMFGEDYRRYRTTTGMLVPGIGRTAR